MNKDYILFHLNEALEELTRMISELSHDPEYSEAEFRTAMEHLYNHLNTAWNARNLNYAEPLTFTTEQFFKWREFPADIDMTASSHHASK